MKILRAISPRTVARKHWSAGHGLGITVDESMKDKYPYRPGPWSIFELESPPTKLALSGDHALPWAGDAHA